MLQIERLRAKNFGPFVGEHTFEFDNGFNVINGRNGHGKTTILDIFNMLLFNDYEGSYDAYINNKSTKFELDLEFSIDGTPYEYKMTFGKDSGKTNKSSKELFRNGKSIASGEDVSTTMSELLDTVIGPYAFSFKQNGTSRITTCSDADRRENLKKLWEIDYTKKVEDVYKPKIKSLGDQIKSIDEQIFALENYAYNTIPIQELPVEEDVYENEKSAAEEMRNRLKMIASLKQSNSDWQNQANTCDATIANKTARITSLEKDIESNEAAIKNSIQRRAQEIDTAKKKFDTNKSQYETEKANLETNIAAMKAKVFMRKRLPILPSVNCQDILSTKASELNIAKRNYAVIQTGVCPTCGGNCKHKTDEFLAEVNRLTEEVAVAQKDLDDYNKLVENCNLIIQENTRIDIEQQQNEIHLQEAEESLKRVEYRLADINFDDEYNRIMSSYHQLNLSYSGNIDRDKRDIEEAKNEITKAESDKATALSNIKEIELSDNDTSLEENLRTIEEEIRQYEVILAQNETAEKHNAEINVLKKDNELKLVGLRDLRVKVATEKSEYEIASEIMLKKYPLWRVNDGADELTNKMNAFIEDIYEKPLDVKFKPDKNLLKMTYGSNADKPIPIYKLSGAEKNLVDVSFINIFNQKLGLGCICLDEYDAPMDDTNKRAAFEAVKNMENSFKQIFVVSHSNDIKNYLIANCHANVISL